MKPATLITTFLSFFILIFGRNELKAHEFYNKASIKINDNAPASLFPSTIGVFGLEGYIKTITVTIQQVTHQNYNDVNIILQGPEGQSILLQNGISKQGAKINKVVYTFKDGWPNLPQQKEITSSYYKPTQYEENLPFNYPAPKSSLIDEEQGFALPGPFLEGYSSLTAVFGGRQANGLWKLFVQDMKTRDDGIILNGWSIDIETECLKQSNPAPNSQTLLASLEKTTTSTFQTNYLTAELITSVSESTKNKSVVAPIEHVNNRKNIEIPALTLNIYPFKQERIASIHAPSLLPLVAKRPTDEIEFLQVGMQNKLNINYEKINLCSKEKLLQLITQHPYDEQKCLSIENTKYAFIQIQQVKTLNISAPIALYNNVVLTSLNEFRISDKIVFIEPTPQNVDLPFDEVVSEKMESLIKKFDPSIEDVKFTSNQHLREAYLILQATENEVCTIKIFDAFGISQWEKQYKLHNGINSIYITTGKLEKGKYNLKYELSSLSGIVKFEQ